MCDGLGAVGGGIVDYEEFPAEVCRVEGGCDEGGDDGEVGALVVGWKDDGIFVGGSGGGGHG